MIKQKQIRKANSFYFVSVNLERKFILCYVAYAYVSSEDPALRVIFIVKGAGKGSVSHHIAVGSTCSQPIKKKTIFVIPFISEQSFANSCQFCLIVIGNVPNKVF